MDKYKGIIISSNQYKDNDFIINVLTEKGEIRGITIRGGMKVGNLNKEFQNPLTIAEFETYKANTKYEKLRCGSIDKNLFLSLSENLQNLEIYGLLAEILKKFPPLEGEIKYYKLLDLTINNLIEKERKYFYTFIFLTIYIKLLGYTPLFNFDHLETHEVYFNFNDLIFVENVKEETSRNMAFSENEYHFLKAWFSKKYRELELIEVDEKEAKNYIKMLISYLSNVAEIKIVGLF